MSKKKRIKKLVKGHLNSKNAAGADIYTTAQDKIDRLAVLDDITQTSAAQLLEALTGTTGGDADGVAFAADAFPFDAREKADADSDGIGDNREIVTLYQQLLAIQADSAVVAARATDAAALIVTTGAQLLELQEHKAGGADPQAGDYATALGLFNAAVLSLETIRTNAQAKLAEAVTAKAAMLALPRPAAGITYDTIVARDKWDEETANTGIHAAIVVLVGNIDTEAEVADTGEGLRVADADRAAAALTSSP
jgi:hypothetical protein